MTSIESDRQKCTCDMNPATMDGPSEDCPNHGNVRLFAHLLSEALDTIERVKAVLDDPGGPDSWSHTFEGQHSVFVHDIREALRKPPDAMGIQRQNPDGSYSPTEPMGWQEEHNWLARLIFWLRRIEHCNDREGQRKP